MAYIHYDQKSNGVIYASLYESFRDKGKVKTRRVENLGRVIDKNNNIFCQKGITYQYILGEGRREVPPSALPSEPVVPESEKLILDFGDAWFLQEYLSRQPFYNSIINTLPDESDTLFALIFYRLLTNKGASCHAKIWYEGNYSYLAVPHANLTSQNISRVLKELGKAKSLNAESIFSYLRNQKCKVYKDYAIPQEPRKEANAIYDIFKVQVPYKIPLTTIEV